MRDDWATARQMHRKTPAGRPSVPLRASRRYENRQRGVAQVRNFRLEIEGAEGCALRGDVQRAAESEFAGAAAEGFFGGNASEVGSVVLLGNVREDEMLGSSIE